MLTVPCPKCTEPNEIAEGFSGHTQCRECGHGFDVVAYRVEGALPRSTKRRVAVPADALERAKGAVLMGRIVFVVGVILALLFLMPVLVKGSHGILAINGLVILVVAYIVSDLLGNQGNILHQLHAVRTELMILLGENVDDNDAQ